MCVGREGKIPADSRQNDEKLTPPCPFFPYRYTVAYPDHFLFRLHYLELYDDLAHLWRSLFTFLSFSGLFFFFLTKYIHRRFCLLVTVRLHGRDAEADGTVRELHHEGDRLQATGRHDTPRHQSVLLPLLDVQSWPGSLDQRKSFRSALDVVPYLARETRERERSFPLIDCDGNFVFADRSTARGGSARLIIEEREQRG